MYSIDNFPYSVAISGETVRRSNISIDTIELWVNDNIGAAKIDWYFTVSVPTIYFEFRDPKMAAWFTLRWGHLLAT